MIYCVQRAAFKPLGANRLASWNLTVQRSWGQSTNAGSKVLPFPSLPCSLMFQHSLFALCWWDLAARCCVTQDKQWIMSGHNECATWVWLLSDLDAIKTEERNFFGLVWFGLRGAVWLRRSAPPAQVQILKTAKSFWMFKQPTFLLTAHLLWLYTKVYSLSHKGKVAWHWYPAIKNL